MLGFKLADNCSQPDFIVTNSRQPYNIPMSLQIMKSGWLLSLGSLEFLLDEIGDSEIDQ